MLGFEALLHFSVGYYPNPNFHTRKDLDNLLSQFGGFILDAYYRTEENHYAVVITDANGVVHNGILPKTEEMVPVVRDREVLGRHGG